MPLATAIATLSGLIGAPAMPVLKHSDVVFMSGAEEDVYRQYGATVLAWGGTPTPEGLAAAKEAGVTYFGSVGMVTEFARFIDEFPGYEEAVCIDVEGNRLKVPWLWDHQHNGVPAYWFCTNQPIFREYLRRRVVETVTKGADGVHVDDHLGTAGNSWLGGCYCGKCMEGFRAHAAEHCTGEELAAAGVTDAATLDYRAVVLSYLAAHPDEKEKRWQWPLAHHFAAFESQAAAAFMMELRTLAAETAGRPVPFSANAGVPSIAHLSDHEALDFLSCEVDQAGATRQAGDGVAFAYRMADAVGRPVAATASGWDWAMICEENREALVRTWIAQAYAMGHYFMTPHYQWCYTQEKGTHWYKGPAEEYAWLFQFVRSHADLLDGYEMVAPVGVLVSAADYRAGRGEPEAAAAELVRAGVPFRVVLAGDDMLESGLYAQHLAACQVLVAAATQRPAPGDAALIDDAVAAGTLRRVADTAGIVADPSLRIEVLDAENVWAVPRVRTSGQGAPGVIHVVNRRYDAEVDATVPQSLRLRFAPALLGLAGVTEAVLHLPGADPLSLKVGHDGELVELALPEVGLWSIVELR